MLSRSFSFAAKWLYRVRGLGRLFEPAGQGPRYRTTFGGTWTDLSNARDVLRGKLQLGLVTDDDAKRLEQWIDDGFVIIEGAVPRDVIDRIHQDIETAWEGNNRALHVEYWEDGVMHITPATPELKTKQGKLLDLHASSEAARRAVFAPPIARFLKLLFERPILAFQSLYFERGTQQPMHQDAAYVVVSSRLEMAASWIALEDVKRNTGELEYYVGSHRLKPFLFDGIHKSLPPGMPVNSEQHDRFLQQIHEQAAAMGLKREKFTPKKGDALIWHADLAHGGSQEMDPKSSRKSLVTHYCPLELEPAYFGDGSHSEKIQCGEGVAYAYPLRSQSVQRR